MRLERFELAIERFTSTAPDGVIQKETEIDGKSEAFGEGGGFITLRSIPDADYAQGFFNLTQIKNVNITGGKLTYSGSMSAAPENFSIEVSADTLAITPIR